MGSIIKIVRKPDRLFSISFPTARFFFFISAASRDPHLHALRFFWLGIFFHKTLHKNSSERQEKEAGISNRFIEKFENGLAKLAAGLTSPRGEKRHDRILQRIGRLQEKSHGIGRHYRIDIIRDATGDKVLALSWEKVPIAGTMLTHPGVYCLRTNELTWDEKILWQTYTMLTDLEAVFRSLKSELGLRPVYHHKEDRAEGLVIEIFIVLLTKGYEEQSMRDILTAGCLAAPHLRVYQ